MASAIAGVSASARADVPLPAGVSVEWSGPDDCPSASRVRASVATLLRGSAEDHSGAPLWFGATVSRAEGRFQLEVSTRSPAAGEAKTLVGESCATLADAYALIVAFTVDPHLSGPEPLAPSTPGRVVTPPRSFDRAAEQPPPPAPSTPGARWGIGALGAASAGNLPFPAFGVGALLAYGERPRWELAAVIWPSQERTLTEAQRALGVRVNLLVARPSVCLPLREGGALAICASAEVGRMAGAGSGSLAGTGQSWWFAVGAGVATHTGIAGPLRLGLRLDVGVPFLRPTFVSERPAGPREIWQPAAVFAALSVIPELTLSSTEGPGAGHNR